jgi:hypothetical protein
LRLIEQLLGTLPKLAEIRQANHLPLASALPVKPSKSTSAPLEQAYRR